MRFEQRLISEGLRSLHRDEPGARHGFDDTVLVVDALQGVDDGKRRHRSIGAIVDDADTAEALKPYYRFLCKRPLSSDDYYPTFNRPNVDLIDVSDTKGVERMTAFVQ